MTNIKKVFILLAFALCFLPFNPSQAATPAVRAVLFFSPYCGHCEKVIKEDLPPIQSKYPDTLRIAMVDVTDANGQALYQKAVTAFNIPDNRLGVPALIVGENFLVGDQEIPAQLPGLIAAGLSAGGIDWPDLPGLSAFTGEADAPTAPSAQVEDPTLLGGMLQKYQRDVAGNTLAVVVLLGMLASLVFIAYLYVVGSARRPWPGWVVPLLCLVGIFVAVYLTFVETTQSQAICGPIGDCNSVQKSAYATLFGFLPVGVLGLLGYLAILFFWLVARLGPEKWRRLSWQGIFAMSIFGVLFSIYLTFLEPFVIGATCIWCITSAIVMTLLLWAASAQLNPAPLEPAEPLPA